MVKETSMIIAGFITKDYRIIKIKDAGKIVDVTLLDHLIVTSESYYSFADNGEI